MPVSGKWQVNDQVAGGVNAKALSGRDDRGRAVLGDDGGAGILLARAEFIAGVDFGLELLAVE